MNVMDVSNGISIGELGNVEDFLGEIDFQDNPLAHTPKVEEIDVESMGLTEENKPEPTTNETKAEGKEVTPEPTEEVKPQETEPKKEEKPKEVKEEPAPTKQENVVEQESQESVLYKGVINDLIKEGLLSEIGGIEDENGEVIPLENVEFDKEVFYSIIANGIEDIKAKAAENKVSLEGVSDFTKRIIDIDKQGGDVRAALDTYNNFKNPIESLNLDNANDQIKVVYLRYKAENKLDDQTIMDIIRSRKEAGTLRDTAEQSKAQMEQLVELRLKSIEEQAKEKVAKEKQELKEYRSDLNEAIGKTFQLKDSDKTRLLDLATKREENGLYGVDNLYYQAMNDPEKATKLLMFLTNEEEYNKQVSEKRARETELKTMKTIKIVSKGKGSNLNINNRTEERDNNTFNVADMLSNI